MMESEEQSVRSTVPCSGQEELHPQDVGSLVVKFAPRSRLSETLIGYGVEMIGTKVSRIGIKFKPSFLPENTICA